MIFRAYFSCQKWIFCDPKKQAKSIINAGKSFEFKGLLHGKYNRYIRTMETIPYFDKLSIWFDEPEYMYMTKMLKTYLDNIKNKFKLYSEYFEQF